MSTKQDYYKTLGVEKSASSSDIKKAYRKLVKVHHPDSGGDEEKFKEISEAYNVLSDSEKKANYDRFGHDQQRPSGFSHQQHFHQERVGSSMPLSVTLTLEEIFTGVKKKYKYNRNVTCDDCDGHGGTGISNCPNCGGSGATMRIINTPIGQIRQMIPCHVCEGVGTTYTQQCNTCHGHGIMNKEDVLEVDIPAGVQSGVIFVMYGKGHAVKNGTSGDLHIKIFEAPHKTYIRSGADLRLKLKLDYSQLMLGDKIEVETIDGGKIRVTIPEYSDVGVDLRVQNKGLKHYGSDNRGDLIITLGINIPKNITDETKELLVKLRDEQYKNIK